MINFIDHSLVPKESQTNHGCMFASSEQSPGFPPCLMGARSCQGPKVLAVQRAREAVTAIEAVVFPLLPSSGNICPLIVTFHDGFPVIHPFPAFFLQSSRDTHTFCV